MALIFSIFLWPPGAPLAVPLCARAQTYPSATYPLKSARTVPWCTPVLVDRMLLSLRELRRPAAGKLRVFEQGIAAKSLERGAAAADTKGFAELGSSLSVIAMAQPNSLKTKSGRREGDS